MCMHRSRIQSCHLGMSEDYTIGAWPEAKNQTRMFGLMRLRKRDRQKELHHQYRYLLIFLTLVMSKLRYFLSQFLYGFDLILESPALVFVLQVQFRLQFYMNNGQKHLLQEPDDPGPTRLVGYFILGWFILSIILSIALNRQNKFVATCIACLIFYLQLLWPLVKLPAVFLGRGSKYVPENREKNACKLAFQYQ